MAAAVVVCRRQMKGKVRVRMKDRIGGCLSFQIGLTDVCLSPSHAKAIQSPFQCLLRLVCVCCLCFPFVRSWHCSLELEKEGEIDNDNDDGRL